MLSTIVEVCRYHMQIFRLRSSTPPCEYAVTEPSIIVWGIGLISEPMRIVSYGFRILFYKYTVQTFKTSETLFYCFLS